MTNLLSEEDVEKLKFQAEELLANPATPIDAKMGLIDIIKGALKIQLAILRVTRHEIAAEIVRDAVAAVKTDFAASIGLTGPARTD